MHLLQAVYLLKALRMSLLYAGRASVVIYPGWAVAR